jgi:hypothetical protein
MTFHLRHFKWGELIEKAEIHLGKDETKKRKKEVCKEDECAIRSESCTLRAHPQITSIASGKML